MRIGNKIGRQVVHIQAENAGPEILVETLTVAAGVVGVTFVAEREIKVAVRAEMDVAAVVVGGFIKQRQQR